MTAMRWDQTIAQRLAPVIIQGMKGGLPRWRAVNQAQKALLPPELHRPIRDNFMFTGHLAKEVAILQAGSEKTKAPPVVNVSAVAWSLEYLKNGAVTVKQMQADALKAGFIWRDTMRIALRHIGAETIRGPGAIPVFTCQLPTVEQIAEPAPSQATPIGRKGHALGSKNLSRKEIEEIAVLAAQEMNTNGTKMYKAVDMIQRSYLPPELVPKTSGLYVGDTMKARIRALLAPGAAAEAEPAPEVPETAHLDYPKEYLVEPPAEEVPAAPAPPSEARRPPTSIPARLNAIDARLASMEWMMMRLLSIMEEHPIQLPGVQEIVNDHLPKMREIAKSKVLIVGCNSIQFQEVEKEWSPYFNLSWQHENPSQERVRGADYVIGVVRFMNHSCEHSIRKHMSTRLDRYIRVNTPVVEVSRTLGVIFSKENTFQ